MTHDPIAKILTRNNDALGLDLETHLLTLTDATRKATIGRMLERGQLRPLNIGKWNGNARARPMARFLGALNDDPISLNDEGTHVLPAEFVVRRDPATGQNSFRAPRRWGDADLDRWVRRPGGGNHPVTKKPLAGRVMFDVGTGKAIKLGVTGRRRTLRPRIITPDYGFGDSPPNPRDRRATAAWHRRVAARVAAHTVAREAQRRAEYNARAAARAADPGTSSIVEMTSAQRRAFMNDASRHKPCRGARPGADYVCNPVTGRWVKRTGRVGRILAQYTR